MANNFSITPGSGDTVTGVDLTSFTAYPATGKVPAGVIYASQSSGVAPAAVTTANPLPVSAIPASPTATSFLPVRITDGSNYIGSGTEYTEGDAATTPKGSAIFWVSGTTAHAVSTSNPLPISDAGGSLTVDGTVGVSGSVAVTGTFWQSTQPVSGTVTANAGTGTFAVSAASLPLPSGAATAAKQPALGTAGSASADVLSVQGVASMTALKVDGSAVTQPVSLASVPSHAVTNAGTFAVQATGTVTANIGTSGSLALDASVAALQVSQGSTTSGQKGGLGLGAVTTAAPSYTTAQSSPLSLTTAGALRVDASATTQPVSGTLTAVTTVTTCSTVTNLAQLGGAAVAMGTGVRSAGTQRVTIATDDVVPASQSGTWTMQPGNTANTTPWLTTDTPATSGGLSFTHITAAATNNKTQVKGSAGMLYGIHAINLTATTKYLKVFNNTSAGVTAGTTAADYQFPIPANGTTGAGFVLELNKGVAHSTGITVMVTGGVSLADNTSLAANDCVVTLFWK